MVVMGMGIAFLPSLYVKSEIRDRDELRVTDVSGINVFRSHSPGLAPFLAGSRFISKTRREDPSVRQSCVIAHARYGPWRRYPGRC